MDAEDEDPEQVSRDAWQLSALALATLVVVSVVAADWESPIRTALALSFLLFVPGLALTMLLRIRDPLHQLAIATGASLAIETLVATALLSAGAFSAAAAVVGVCGITCLLLLGAARRRHTPTAGA